MWKSAFAFMVAILAANQSLLAGLMIDLRPVQAGPYDCGTVIDVKVFLVDTGNPQGAIQLRSVFLDFTDSDSAFSYPDPDGAGPLVSNQFSWINPFTVGAVFEDLPQTSRVYPLPTANPLFQITVPNDGEVQIGSLKVNVGHGFLVNRTLDVMNDDVADPNFGARVDFGFGGPGDPVTTWRAFDGQLTGGTEAIQITSPEPSSLLLILTGAMCLIRKRNNTARTR